MGKPFSKELEKINETYTWAIEESINDLSKDLNENINKPLFVIGSGGSLSACHFAAMLYQQHGQMAKAITPLELLYSKNALKESNVMFISASGKNTDIIFGYETAISYEPNKIYNLCMTENSPLAELSKKNTISKTYEFNLPTGKDGFLATNSLIAIFTLLFNSLTLTKQKKINQIGITEEINSTIDGFLDKVTVKFTFLTLFGSWGLPVGIDLESKFAEAALADILLSDYRNFGHGRHHWLDKRGEETAIIALITPQEENLANKTLALLPKNIPVLKLKSSYTNGLASIDLLMQSFYLVQKIGKKQNIDPGKPGVPDFGSKLYNLQYKNLYKEKETELSWNALNAIKRKITISNFFDLSIEERKYWVDAYQKYKDNLESKEYGVLILDYDGTLCSNDDRYNGINTEVAAYLTEILKKGIIIGIATGRGKSVRTDLQSVIDKNLWKNIIVGYYNCSDIGFLENNDLPNKENKINEKLEQLFQVLNKYNFPVEVKSELRPQQITIAIDDKKKWQRVRGSLLQLIMNQNLPNIQVLESSHSMDIIDKGNTSKLNILSSCINLAKELKISTHYLCIGDKGKWPGNDYQLLSSTSSLSVDEVSPLADSCWNFSSPGIKNIKATLYYLSCLKASRNGLTIKIK